MPHGRRMKKSGPNNVQNKLTTRLMQISLKMDDHIYYNKLVTRTAAEEFLQEVARLKLKCPREDIRALQVIDKVTTFMKNIIAEDREQETLSTPSIQTYIDYSQSHSPVYSLLDEDRIENTTLCSSLDDVSIIDITEDSNDTNSKEQNNAIDRVNFAISNMAIEDKIVSPVEMLTDDDCSQSILDNFHIGNTSLEAARMTDLSNKNPITQITNKLSCDIPTNNTLATTDTQVITEPTQMIENRNPEISDFSRENTISNFITYQQQVSVAKEKSKVVHRKKNKELKKVTRKRKPKSTNINSDEATKTMSRTNNPSKDRKDKSIVTPIDAELSDVNKAAAKNYNQNVENDLTWVEYLRYVREIGPDENDPALCNLEDNFWDNFSLPNEWNDNDFEY